MLKFSKSDLPKIKRNVFLYQEALSNQNKKISELADELESNWKSEEARKTISALRDAGEKLSQVSKSVDNYVKPFAKIKQATDEISGQ